MMLNAPKILTERPPIFNKIIEAGLKPNELKTIYTYGDTIYNPGGMEIPPDLICHEMVHMRQQREMEGGPDGWWDLYLKNANMRLEWEVEAYVAQYKYFCSRKKSRNAQLSILAAIAIILSGPTYGHMITAEDAIRMVRNEAGIA